MSDVLPWLYALLISLVPGALGTWCLVLVLVLVPSCGAGVVSCCKCPVLVHGALWTWCLVLIKVP